MAYRLTWLADVLKARGLKVVEHAGWQNRGRGEMGNVIGVMLHHTAGPASGDLPSLGTVLNGRPADGIPGPLSQLMLSRSGVWHVIAAGVANHAGRGYAPWVGRDNGNLHLLGVEAESTGRGDWTAAQLVAYPRGVAALLDKLNEPTERAIAHKEWAPDRKIDIAGWPGDVKGFRQAVDWWRENPNGNEEDFLVALDEWKQERIFDWEAEGAMGMAGRNFNGRRFDYEQARIAELNAQNVAILALLTKVADGVTLTEEEVFGAVNDALEAQRPKFVAEATSNIVNEVRGVLPGLLREELGDDFPDETAERVLAKLGDRLRGDAEPATE